VLCDSFDTALALESLADLIRNANVYMNSNAHVSVEVLKELARWITRMVEIFGLTIPQGDQVAADRIGWSVDGTSSENLNKEEAAIPYVRVLSKFRDAMKRLAIANTSLPISREILALSDTIRDDDLVSLGVSLEDRNSARGEPALVKFAPVETLIAARDEKRRLAAEAGAKKEAVRIEKEKKVEKAKVSPTEIFKTDEYSEWDVEGVPIKSKDGAEVTLSQKKKLKKLWEKQDKIHREWRKGQGA